MTWPLGNAAFRYTPIGGTVEVTHRLQASFRSPTPGYNGTRFTHRALVKSVIHTVTIAGSSVPEVEVDLRYEDDPWAALTMLREAADGAVLTYYPDLGVPGESYPLRLVGVGDSVELPGDVDMALLARYGGRFRFARVDGGSLTPLTSQGVLFRYDPGASLAGATFSRASTALYRSRTGAGTLPLASAAINIIRDRHFVLDPLSGLYLPSTLLEAARTNLLLRSQEFDNAAWTKSGATISANADTAPDNAATADRIVESSGGTNHALIQTHTGTANGTYALSCYLKAGTRSWIMLRFRETATITNTVSCSFNLSTGTVGTAVNGGTGSGATGRIEAAGNGWYRCILTGAVNNAATALGSLLLLATGDGVISYSGDGASYISAWGAQFEDAAQSSSYIATTSAAVTRSADSLSFTLAGGAAVPQALTLYLKLIEGGTSLIDDARVVHIGASATDSNSLLIQNRTADNGYRAFFSNGVTSTATNHATRPSIGQPTELRLSLSTAGALTFGQSINGATEAVVSAAAVSLPAAWGGSLLILNSDGSAAKTGFASFLKTRLARGVRTLDEMRGL